MAVADLNGNGKPDLIGASGHGLVVFDNVAPVTANTPWFFNDSANVYAGTLNGAVNGMVNGSVVVPEGSVGQVK